MNIHLPKTSSLSFTVSAILLGMALIDDLSSLEQSALCAWLTLVADVLGCHGSYQALEEESQNENEIPFEETLKQMKEKMEELFKDE